MEKTDFFGLTGVRSAGDQHHFALEINRDDRLGAAAMAVGVGFEAWEIHNNEFRVKHVQFFRHWLNQQILNEQ